MKRPQVFDNYDPKRELPLAGYTTLVSVFGLALSGALYQAHRRKAGSGFRPADVLLLGVATYQLTRTVAKDRVLAAFRAPFTKYEESAGAGELKETSRGVGVQKAIGDLLTCPYCLAPWIGGLLSFGLLKQPSATRWPSGLFSVVAISDAAQQGYAALKKLSS